MCAFLNREVRFNSSACHLAEGTCRCEILNSNSAYATLTLVRLNNTLFVRRREARDELLPSFGSTGGIGTAERRTLDRTLARLASCTAVCRRTICPFIKQEHQSGS